MRVNSYLENDNYWLAACNFSQLREFRRGFLVRNRTPWNTGGIIIVVYNYNETLQSSVAIPQCVKVKIFSTDTSVKYTTHVQVR